MSCFKKVLCFDFLRKNQVFLIARLLRDNTLYPFKSGICFEKLLNFAFLVCLNLFHSTNIGRLEVKYRDRTGCGRRSLCLRSSKGSKLVIRQLKGSKLPGCNFHTQIYDLASRGLYSTETTLHRPPALPRQLKVIVNHTPSFPQHHHTFPSRAFVEENTLTDLSFPLRFSLMLMCPCFTWNNPATSFPLIPLKERGQSPLSRRNPPVLSLLVYSYLLLFFYYSRPFSSRIKPFHYPK